MQSVFVDICSIEAHDGVIFLPDTVRAIEIRKDASYAGVRVTLVGIVDGARCHVQIDVGFGDAVTPEPEDVDYPVILQGFESPKLRVYPRYTVIAEKVEAIASLGIANTRMKDYFDLWVLARHSQLDGTTLRQAIRATFDRRETALTPEPPFGLTLEFARDAQKQAQWQAFQRRNRLDAPALDEIVASLGEFLRPVLDAASADATFPFRWQAGAWVDHP